MAELVQRLMDYVQTFPPDGAVGELQHQLGNCMHRDLRAACGRLHLRGANQHSTKSGYISLLTAFWKGELEADQPVKVNTLSEAMSEASDVRQFVQQFPLDGKTEELRDELYGCKARTLRSACVLMELHPRKNHSKPNFVALLVGYWKNRGSAKPDTPKSDKVATSAPKSDKVATSAPKSGKVATSALKSDKPSTKRREEVDTPKSAQKRPGDDNEKEVTKKKKVMEQVTDHVEEKKETDMAASLEKAKVVKEWASAIEILSRVDGSAESIASIRALIDGVVGSAVSEL